MALPAHAPLPRPLPPAVRSNTPRSNDEVASAGWRARLRALLPRFYLPTLLVLAAALRLPNLATNPGWDGDEGYNFDIALNLAHGRHQMFALDFAFVQHPPLYFALAAGLFRLLGPGMLALRLLSVTFCLGTLALLPALGRAMAMDRATGTRIGLTAAAIYAIWPFVALQNRFGYTYNGLAFWTALALLALLRYRQSPGRGALALCGLAGAAALATDQEALYLLPVLALGLRGASLGRRLAALALALSGPALYLGALALSDRATLLFDLTHTAGRVTGGSAVFQAEMWLYNLADLLRIDPLLPLGLTGLALLPYRPARRLTLGLLAAMLLVILKVRDPNPLFRTAEPLLPLACLGVGACGALLWARLERAWSRGPGAARLASARSHGEAPGAAPSRGLRLAAALLFVGALVTGVDAQRALTRFRTPIDGLLPRSTADAQAMAGWLNERLRPDDVVLAMPQVSWLLHARTAELLQAVAITGRATAFYPAGIAPRRWVYDVHLAAARFLVVDGFTQAWISQSPGERALVRRARRSWRLVYARGEYRVYENPADA